MWSLRIDKDIHPVISQIRLILLNFLGRVFGRLATPQSSVVWIHSQSQMEFPQALDICAKLVLEGSENQYWTLSIA